MLRPGLYAAAPISYTWNDKELIICCPAHAFKDSTNIPAEYERVPNVQNVYRMRIDTQCSPAELDKFRELLTHLTFAHEAKKMFDQHMQEFRNPPAAKISMPTKCG